MIRDMLIRAMEARAEQLLRAAGLERRRTLVDYTITAATCFMAGAMVGSCIALLLAPSSGEELRSRLNESMRAAGERARRAARARAARAGRAYEEGTSNAAS